MRETSRCKADFCRRSLYIRDHAERGGTAMTGLSRSSAGLDVRRRRALYRAWHRGMREMDLVLGRFAEQEIGRMSEAELAGFEALLDVPDITLMSWILGQEPAAAPHDTGLVRRIRDHFREHAD
jgi:antitoxin CptB